MEKLTKDKVDQLIKYLSTVRLDREQVDLLYQIFDKHTTVSIISNILNLTTRRVSQYAEEGKFEKVDRNKYNLKQCVQAYIEFIKLPNKDNITDRHRYEKLKADKLEKELEILNAQFINVHAACQAWGKVIETVRARLLSYPTQTAMEYKNLETIPEIEEYSKKQIYRILNELKNPDLYELAEGIQEEKRERNLKRRK